MTKFKIGDKVRLSEVGCQKYIDDGTNPHDGVGTIYSIGDYEIFVRWSEYKNVYLESELDIVPAHWFIVGNKYTAANGSDWTCIAIVGDDVYLSNGYSAYIWGHDGKAKLGEDFDIKFEPVRETVTKKISVSIDGKHHCSHITFDLVDGEPDWERPRSHRIPVEPLVAHNRL